MNLPSKIDHTCKVTEDIAVTVNSLISFLEEKKCSCHICTSHREWLEEKPTEIYEMYEESEDDGFKTIKKSDHEKKFPQSDEPKKELVNRMVDRFLSWRLPDDFNPDCGIHFDANEAKKLNPRNQKYEPVGTNLFTAQQAEEMVRYLLEDSVTSTPHWESDYAAIWERFEEGDTYLVYEMRQDILELIRKIMK